MIKKPWCTNLAPGIGICLLDWFPVVDPSDLRHGCAARLAFDHRRLTFGEVLQFRLDGEERRGCRRITNTKFNNNTNTLPLSKK